jgi:hypothetical protein
MTFWEMFWKFMDDRWPWSAVWSFLIVLILGSCVASFSKHAFRAVGRLGKRKRDKNEWVVREKPRTP